MWREAEAALARGSSSGGYSSSSRPRSRYWVGQRVRALLRLEGENGQRVFKGSLGTVTSVPGPGSDIGPGAVAEVLINGVRFDAEPNMIEEVKEVYKLVNLGGVKEKKGGNYAVLKEIITENGVPLFEKKKMLPSRTKASANIEYRPEILPGGITRRLLRQQNKPPQHPGAAVSL